jgi:hypothetical protein
MSCTLARSPCASRNTSAFQRPDSTFSEAVDDGEGGQGYSSLFTYGTSALHWSEHEGLRRIAAARAARAYPVILERLEAGDITLTTIGLLSPHLTSDNHRRLLDATRHQCKREVEQLVSTLGPQPPVPSVTRELPARSPARIDTSSAAPPVTPPPDLAALSSTSQSRTPAYEAKPAVVRPANLERYKVQFTVSRNGRPASSCPDLIRLDPPAAGACDDPTPSSAG